MECPTHPYRVISTGAQRSGEPRVSSACPYRLPRQPTPNRPSTSPTHTASSRPERSGAERPPPFVRVPLPPGLPTPVLPRAPQPHDGFIAADACRHSPRQTLSSPLHITEPQSAPIPAENPHLSPSRRLAHISDPLRYPEYTLTNGPHSPLTPLTKSTL